MSGRVLELWNMMDHLKVFKFDLEKEGLMIRENIVFLIMLKVEKISFKIDNFSVFALIVRKKTYPIKRIFLPAVTN